MALENVRSSTSSDGGIIQALQKELSLKKSAVKAAVQCLCWLVKSEIPHTTNYDSLLKTVQFILKHLYQGENAKYTSQCVIQEFLQTLGNQIEELQLQEVKKCPRFSLMIDESTDVAVLNEMVVYIRYITPHAEVKTSFMKILELFNGTAQTSEEAVVNYLDNTNLPFSNMVGFATDGARVMTGRLNGVAARLKRRQPVLISVTALPTG